MLASLRRFNLKLLAAFLLSIVCLIAQDPTSLMTPEIERTGSHLACRCGACRNTVGNCPMIRCSYSEPMRRRIQKMQAEGSTDDQIINTIVREQGIVALAAPPAEGWGLFTWVMPGVALLIGFLVYAWYIRRQRRRPEPADVDAAVLDRFRDQIDIDLDEPANPEKGGTAEKK